MSGIAVVSAAYADQSGTGTPLPMQISSVADPASPVAFCADATSPPGIGLRNSPAPPRMMSAGCEPMAGPPNPPRAGRPPAPRTLVSARMPPPPIVQVKPARGLRCHSRGSCDVLCPNCARMSVFSGGGCPSREASTRRP